MLLPEGRSGLRVHVRLALLVKPVGMSDYAEENKNRPAHSLKPRTIVPRFGCCIAFSKALILSESPPQSMGQKSKPRESACAGLSTPQV